MLPKSSVSPVGRDGLLSDEERASVHQWLNGKLLGGGTLTRSRSIDPAILRALLTSGLSSLRRRYKGWDVSAVDVVWGWIAHMGTMGLHVGNLARRETGGSTIDEWQCSALIDSRWVAQDDDVNLFRQRMSILVRAVAAMASSKELGDGTHELGPLGLHQLCSLTRRHYRDVDIFYIDVMWLVHLGLLSGCCMRLKQHSRKPHLGWWQLAVDDGSVMPHYPSTVTGALANVLRSYDLKYAHALEHSLDVLGGSSRPWFVDLFSGYQSRNKSITAMALESTHFTGDAVVINVDMCPVYASGDSVVVPQWVADLGDKDLFPPGRIIRTIAKRFGLDMSMLIHVFLSSPCETNSPAQTSNVSRGCGYRDVHLPHHPPLPVDMAHDKPMAGYTSQQKHDLAHNHDQLEAHVFGSIIHESAVCSYTFSGENPRGSLQHKAHMGSFHDPLIPGLRIVNVNHCAFGGYFQKDTQYFTNLCNTHWTPVGLTGDGMCGGTGRRTGIACWVGALNPATNRWKHHYAIAQESWREVLPLNIERDQAKNMIPTLQTEEIVRAALLEWDQRQ